MSTTLMTAPAAGWYRDPADAGAWRWWDGSSWTDHVQAVEQEAQPAPAVVIEPVPTHPPVFEQVAPPAPEPAPVPEPVAVPEPVVQAASEPVAQAAPAVQAEPVAQAAPVVQGIPQPGEVAPAPPAAQAAGNVSLTPAIPVTDQMYWHSPAAEKIEVPRLPTASTGAIRVQGGPVPPSYVRDWNDLGSPNNAGIWLLAVSPIVYLGVSVVLGFVNGVSGGVFGQFGAIVPMLITGGLTWIFAYVDQRSLRERGYHPPAIWWMLLLPPLIYFIARGRAVRREGMRAWPPELVFVLSFVGVIGISVLAAMALFALLTGMPGT